MTSLPPHEMLMLKKPLPGHHLHGSNEANGTHPRSSSRVCGRSNGSVADYIDKFKSLMRFTEPAYFSALPPPLSWSSQSLRFSIIPHSRLPFRLLGAWARRPVPISPDLPIWARPMDPTASHLKAPPPRPKPRLARPALSWDHPPHSTTEIT